jgi:hypothetical protein
MDVTTDTFEQEVVKSANPVLVDFWGPSCGPCLALMPQVEKLLSADEGFTLIKILHSDSIHNAAPDPASPECGTVSHGIAHFTPREVFRGCIPVLRRCERVFISCFLDC